MRQDQLESEEYHVKYVESILKVNIDGLKVKNFRPNRQILSIVPEIAVLENKRLLFETWNEFVSSKDENDTESSLANFDFRLLDSLPSYVKFMVELKKIVKEMDIETGEEGKETMINLEKNDPNLIFQENTEDKNHDSEPSNSDAEHIKIQEYKPHPLKGYINTKALLVPSLQSYHSKLQKEIQKFEESEKNAENKFNLKERMILVDENHSKREELNLIAYVNSSGCQSIEFIERKDKK